MLLRAEYPHHVWAIDFQFDQSMDGRRLKFLNILDEYSRFCLAIRVARRCKAVDVIAALEDLLGQYPAPTHLRMDNGPEFTLAESILPVASMLRMSSIQA
jgi:transposase InsO family protein